MKHQQRRRSHPPIGPEIEQVETIIPESVERLLQAVAAAEIDRTYQPPTDEQIAAFLHTLASEPIDIPDMGAPVLAEWDTPIVIDMDVPVLAEWDALDIPDLPIALD